MKHLLLLLLTLSCLPLFAEEVEGLYRATVPVASQAVEARDSGVQHAFADVLVKLTGDSRVVEREPVQAALQQAQSYVSSIGYQNLDGQVDPDVEPQVGLQVSFAPQLVDQFIRREQLPVWPSNRPRLLLWLVGDDSATGRSYINAENDSAVLKKLQSGLQQRGVPYALPGYDLEDQLNLSPDDLWSLDSEKLDQASSRYAVDGWVALRFFTTFAGEVRGAWVHNVGSAQRLTSISVATADELAERAAQQLSDSIAGQYAYVPETNSSEYLLHISGIREFSDYRQLLALIGELEPVVSHRVVSVSGAELTLAVDVEGSLDLLDEALGRSGHFNKSDIQNANDPNVPFAAARATELHFEWLMQ